MGSRVANPQTMNDADQSSAQYKVAVVLGTRPHVVDPRSGFAIWWTEPLGYVSELGESKHVDDAIAEFFINSVRAHMQSIGAARSARVGVNDWSTMTGYDAAARTRLIDYAKANREVISHTAIVLPVTSALGRIGVQTAATLLALMGKQITFPRDVREAITKLGLRASAGPSRGG